MSKPEKRARGKRTLDQASLPSGEGSHGFEPINPPYSTEPQSQLGGPSSSNSRSQKSGFSPLLIPPRGKIAIPSLRSPQSAGGSTKSKKGRTAHACDACRRAKAGCTGETPCGRCRNAGVECVYGDGKRDRDRKQLVKLSQETDSLSRANSGLVEAFRRIRNDTSLSLEEMREEIDAILATIPARTTLDTYQPSAHSREGTSEQRTENSDNEDDNSEVGSTESIDVINVDTDCDATRPTGHLGKSSSVAWAKRTADAYLQVHEKDLDPPAAQRRDEMAYTLASYHTEDADLEEVDTTNVDPYEWPTAQEADALMHEYFNHVHSALPLVNKHSVLSRFMAFDRRSRDLSSEDKIFLASLNIMFAISSVFLQLTGSSGREWHLDNYIYLARAKRLSLDDGLLYQDARVSTACASGLMCLYFLCVCKLNRAWTFGGLALRQAFTLGLHNRNASRELPDPEKEYRVRLWWSLFSLECLLNELTGRPSGVSNRDVSTPLPVNVDEDNLYQHESLYSEMQDVALSIAPSRSESHDSRGRSSATYHKDWQPLSYTFPTLSLSPTTSTYFIYRTQLSILSHQIVTQLYCASSIRDKWSEVQHTIQRIDARLMSWKDSLSPAFDISISPDTHLDWDSPHTLERIGLATLFHSSRMILFRPCLCRFSGRRSTMTNSSSTGGGHKPSSSSQDYNQEAAMSCLTSARTMISLLSLTLTHPYRNTQTTPSKALYSIPPFWPTLHYLAESLSVLLLELAFQSAHITSQQSALILSDIVTAITWLTEMSTHSVSARKAWEIFDRLVRMVAPRELRWKLEGLPVVAGVPEGYNWRRFEAETEPVGVPQWQSQGSRIGPAPSFFAPQTQPQNMYAAAAGSHLENPLDHSSAVQRFENLSSRYGVFDEPWGHMFVPSDLGEDVSMGGMGVGSGFGMTGGAMGSGVSAGPGPGMSSASRDPYPLAQPMSGMPMSGGGLGGGSNEGYGMMGYQPSTSASGVGGFGSGGAGGYDRSQQQQQQRQYPGSRGYSGSGDGGR